MKNYLCLFKRPFKIQKNVVFRFEISFFVLEIWTFFYYANQITDDVIQFATERWKYLIKDISGNIEAVFLKLGTTTGDH